MGGGVCAAARIVARSAHSGTEYGKQASCCRTIPASGAAAQRAGAGVALLSGTDGSGDPSVPLLATAPLLATMAGALAYFRIKLRERIENEAVLSYATSAVAWLKCILNLRYNVCIFARGGPNVFTKSANFYILMPKSEVNSRSRIALSIQMTLVISMRYKEIQVMCRT